MTGIREWMSRRSGPELFVINGVYFGLAMWVFSLVMHTHFGLIGLVVAGLLFGALTTALTLTARRRAGGANLIVEVGSAIHSGELPAFFDRGAWLNQLEIRLRNLRSSLVWTPVTFGAIVLFTLIDSVLSKQVNFALLGIALLVAAVGVASLVNTRRRIPKIVALLKKVQDSYVPPTRVEPTS